MGEGAVTYQLPDKRNTHRPPEVRFAQPIVDTLGRLMASMRRMRVAVYVERGSELLVFEHCDHPEAGTQIPAGGIEDGEGPCDAVVREVEEETGVRLLTAPMYLGEYEHDDGVGRPATTLFFRAQAPEGLPPSWEHLVASGDESGLVFLCRFDANPTLWPVQAIFR
jgi:8-oxo-dGTP pyrophosphatase MutT (NUDIX family)